MKDPIDDVKNLALTAALDASGVPVTGERTYNPMKYGDLPKATNVGAGMMIIPQYYVVEGYVGGVKTEEFYHARKFGIDSARFNFQLKYNGARGVTVHPLYDLRRYGDSW